MKRIKYLSIIILQLLCFQSYHIFAEAILDGTMNPETSGMLLEGEMEISSDYGKIKGSNLFHSFTTFNINKGESANFTGPDAIQNIFTRVTGNSSSWINGTLSSSIPNSDFYLLNPNGVMIGENALIDIGGSFYISTSDYLQMNDGTQFDVDSQEPVLSIEKPQAFGFLDSSNGKITIEGKEQQAILELKPEKSFFIIGGDIEIKNSMIMAEGGNVNLASIHSEGQYLIEQSDFGGSDNIEKGQITLSDNTTISVWGENTGSIKIRSNHFSVDNSVLEAISQDHSSGFIDIHSDRIS